MSYKNILIDTKIEVLQNIIKQLTDDIATYESLREPEGKS